MVVRNFKPSDRTDKNVIHQSFERDSNPEVREKIWREIQDINDEMMFFLGTRNNALCAYYPCKAVIYHGTLTGMHKL